MRKIIGTSIIVVVILALAIVSLVLSPYELSINQINTFKILLIICLCSVLYCFIVGEISRNNSQMDKLWSILPIAYTWVIAIQGNFNIRLVVIAILVTLWGIRLTINFARKGAYSIKFWTGEEDYRWKVLRSQKPFNNKAVWCVFDLLFISLYQNVLVLAISLPALACMESTASFGAIDIVATVLVLGFLVLETISDEQQFLFHNKKKALLAQLGSLDKLPYPYNLGFNTFGLWNRSRHPNYLGEQGFWFCLFLFVVGAKATNCEIFNWSIIGSLFLILLFLGSSTLGEKISSSKYPLYSDYISKTSKYIPLTRYRK